MSDASDRSFDDVDDADGDDDVIVEDDDVEVDPESIEFDPDSIEFDPEEDAVTEPAAGEERFVIVESDEDFIHEDDPNYEPPERPEGQFGGEADPDLDQGTGVREPEGDTV